MDLRILALSALPIVHQYDHRASVLIKALVLGKILGNVPQAVRRLLLLSHIEPEIGTITYKTDLGHIVMPIRDEVRNNRGTCLALNSFHWFLPSFI